MRFGCGADGSCHLWHHGAGTLLHAGIGCVRMRLPERKVRDELQLSAASRLRVSSIDAGAASARTRYPRRR